MSNATDVIQRALEGKGFPSDDPGEALNHLERCEEAIMQVAVAMMESEWDADLTNYVSEIVSRVAPHPGGRLDEGRDPATGVGPIERYMHDLVGHDFTVYMSDIVDARGADDRICGPWEGEES